MSAHNAPFELHDAPVEMPLSATNGATLTVDRSPCVINLSSAGAETRTLALPTRAGVLVSLHMQTDGGDITLTVASAYTEDGETTFTFSEVGQTLMLQSYQTSAGVFFWRKISDYGLGNVTPAEAAGASANAVVGVAAGYKVARGEAALDGSNPTPVATGLATVVAFTATLKGTAAPGDSTSVLTADISGATVNVYAWKHTTGGAAGNPTLVASTGTESFYWVAIGT